MYIRGAEIYSVCTDKSLDNVENGGYFLKKIDDTTIVINKMNVYEE